MVAKLIKNIEKNIFLGERGISKMCQGRCGEQPPKVPILQLRRSINCGTFLSPNSVFLQYLKFYSA